MKYQRGFTLIEIMVVVVIISILMGAVALSFPKTEDDLLKENANRFVALVSLMQDEAVLQSRDMAIGVFDSGYKFYSRESGAWVNYSDAPFIARTLKGNIKSDLYLEGIAIKLKNQSKTSPQIVILSSGEVTPFTYFLGEAETSNITIKVNAIGMVKQVFKRNENE